MPRLLRCLRSNNVRNHQEAGSNDVGYHRKARSLGFLFLENGYAEQIVVLGGRLPSGTISRLSEHGKHICWSVPVHSPTNSPALNFGLPDARDAPLAVPRQISLQRLRIIQVRKPRALKDFVSQAPHRKGPRVSKESPEAYTAGGTEKLCRTAR